MGWPARLALRYRRDGEATRAEVSHSGPLRVLKALYPEGPACCHHVIVHPPAGIASGDRLDIEVALEAHTHVLLTTPGATRFYRSDGASGEQHVQVSVGASARLEWLPQETLVYRDADAINGLAFALAPGAEMIGSDVVALGLPEAGQPFDRGALRQSLALHAPGLPGWLDRAHIRADDARLLHSPLGLAGHGAWGLLWWASGQAQAAAAVQTALDAARELAAASPLAVTAGATALQPNVVALRVLGPRVEPISQLLRAVRRRWRDQLWGLAAQDPRLWAT